VLVAEYRNRPIGS